ncbi:60S ribosomal protein L2 [Morus notabilis]|uniref:60S ribosomal protein L2 n=1 Tax=Morus notabilis TaxID=981085 RepID=W9RKL3_9ROSA|nr:60S ribosomal protein L2 [Morus notabilis]
MAALQKARAASKAIVSYVICPSGLTAAVLSLPRLYDKGVFIMFKSSMSFVVFLRFTTGTGAKILKEPSATKSLVRLPLGAENWIDSSCRATIGVVSNPDGAKKLWKAGQSWWLGIRPTVPGVAMNPVDHPHGGGEGRSKSTGNLGRTSQTPWGKPCKSGYKTGPLKRRE